MMRKSAARMKAGPACLTASADRTAIPSSRRHPARGSPQDEPRPSLFLVVTLEVPVQPCRPPPQGPIRRALTVARSRLSISPFAASLTSAVMSPDKEVGV